MPCTRSWQSPHSEIPMDLTETGLLHAWPIRPTQAGYIYDIMPYSRAVRDRLIINTQSAAIGATGPNICRENFGYSLYNPKAQTAYTSGYSIADGLSAGITFSCYVSINAYSNIQRWMFNRSRTANEWLMYFYSPSATNSIEFVGYDILNTTYYNSKYTVSASLLKKWLHVSGMFNISTKVRSLYIDGVSVGADSSDARGTVSSTGTFNLSGGSTVVTTQLLNGKLAFPKIYNVEKDSTWAAAEYKKLSKTIQFKTDWGIQESVADETAGYLGAGNSPFKIDSGTWRIVLDTYNSKPVKAISQIATGYLSLNTDVFHCQSGDASFGTWTFYAYVPTGAAGYLAFGFSQSATGSMANGYSLRMDTTNGIDLYRDAVKLADISGLVADSWVRIDITRRFDGLFEVFVNGVSGGTATDTTYYTGKYINIYGSNANGGKIAYSCPTGNCCILKRIGHTF